MGDHPLSHSNAENFSGGRPIEQQKDCLSLRLWKLLVIAGGVEKSIKTLLVSTLPRHSSQQIPPHISAHNRRGDHGTKHFTRLAWKEEERAVREVVLQQMFLESTKTKYWVLHRYLYPVYKPKPRFKLLTLEDCTPLSHPLSTGSASGLVTALLHCPVFLAPSGVHTGRQLLMLPALLAPSAPPLHAPLVLSCLAPHWSSHALWSCPAWLAPLWSSPCPATSLQAVLRSSSNN